MALFLCGSILSLLAVAVADVDADVDATSSTIESSSSSSSNIKHKRRKRKLQQQQQQQQQQQFKQFTTSEELMNAVDLALEYRANRGGGSNITVADDYRIRVEQVYGPLETWNMSRITNYASLLNANRNPLVQNYNATHDLDLSRWPIGDDTDGFLQNNNIYMGDMFYGASHVDFDVSKWKMERVWEFQGLFELTQRFRDIGLDTPNYGGI